MRLRLGKLTRGTWNSPGESRAGLWPGRPFAQALLRAIWRKPAPDPGSYRRLRFAAVMRLAFQFQGIAQLGQAADEGGRILRQVVGLHPGETLGAVFEELIAAFIRRRRPSRSGSRT